MHVNKKKLKRIFIRKYIRSIRKNLSLSEQYTAMQLITNRIIATDYIYKSKHIAIFISFDGEINTNLLIKTLIHMNKKIYIPILPANIENKNLLFTPYTLSTSLVLNHWNIYEPKTVISTISMKSLNIMFIPLVAFDIYGNRLGMGGGFYDRILKERKQFKYSYIPIGLGYDFQKIPTQLLPLEPWDMKLPEIITPSYHIKW